LGRSCSQRVTDGVDVDVDTVVEPLVDCVRSRRARHGSRCTSSARTGSAAARCTTACQTILPRRPRSRRR
jgi:hypothetical protein